MDNGRQLTDLEKKMIIFMLNYMQDVYDKFNTALKVFDVDMKSSSNFFDHTESDFFRLLNNSVAGMPPVKEQDRFLESILLEYDSAAAIEYMNKYGIGD